MFCKILIKLLFFNSFSTSFTLCNPFCTKSETTLNPEISTVWKSPLSDTSNNCSNCLGSSWKNFTVSSPYLSDDNNSAIRFCTDFLQSSLSEVESKWINGINVLPFTLNPECALFEDDKPSPMFFFTRMDSNAFAVDASISAHSSDLAKASHATDLERIILRISLKWVLSIKILVAPIVPEIASALLYLLSLNYCRHSFIRKTVIYNTFFFFSLQTFFFFPGLVWEEKALPLV